MGPNKSELFVCVYEITVKDQKGDIHTQIASQVPLTYVPLKEIKYGKILANVLEVWFM